MNAWRDLSRGTLEAVAVEGYREGALTRRHVNRLLGLSFWETEAFLKERQAYLAYTEEDFEQDRRDLDITAWPSPPPASHRRSLRREGSQVLPVEGSELALEL